MAKRSSYGDLEKIEKHPNYFRNPISGVIYYRKSHNGAPIKISSGKTQISEAKKVIDDKLIELFSLNPAREKRSKRGVRRPLIKDIFNDIIEERTPQKHKTTIRGYWVSWNHSLKDFWALKTTGQINQQTVTQFENWYLTNYPNRVFFNTAKHLNMIFRYCELQGYIPAGRRPKIRDLDPFIAGKTQKLEVGRVYSDAEINGILNNCSARTRIGVMFGRFMGLRKMEFISMKRDAIDFKTCTVKVWSFKNKHWRTISMPAFFAEELKSYVKSIGDSEFVFPSDHSAMGHIPSQTFDKDWTRAKKLAGIVNWNEPMAARVHDLRHTFATQTAMESWPPLVACDVLDMSLDEYQRTYVHVASFDIKKAMDRTFKKPEGEG